MQPRSQPGLRPGSKSILWLLTVALLFMATPAFSGCPFRHGVRFAASPGMRVPETPESPELPHDDNGHKHGHEMEAARLRSKPEDTLKAPSNSSQPGNGTTSSGRRLQGLIGLGVTTGLDQPLARDTRSAVSGGASVPRATSTTTPYPSTPYGTTAKPTNPVAKDWVSVVSACKVVGQVELRMNNFFIRSAFHDAMAVNVDCPTCSGLDASLLINASEIVRPENVYESFAATTARAVLKIARWYKVSASDVLAVCAAVATETLGGPKVMGPGTKMLQVGRLDGSAAAPLGQLPPADMTADAFAAWWTARGFTPAEGVALMGSHALLDDQSCYRGKGGNPRDYCNPATEKCDDIRMFSWKNHYYVDGCTPSIKVVPNTELPEMAAYDAVTEADTIRADSADEFRADVRREVCKWSSPERRALAEQQALAIRRGKAVALPPKEAATAFWDADIRQCSASTNPAIRANCNHPQTWFYTLNDAHLATACQAGTTGLSAGVLSVKQAMMKYLDSVAWNTDYPAAFHKMVNKYANFQLNPSTKRPALITGTECASGYVSDSPTQRTSAVCTAKACPLGVPRAATCPSVCTCKTLFKAQRARSLAAPPELAVPTTPVVPAGTPWSPPSDAVVGAPLPEADVAGPMMLPDVAPTSMPAEGSGEVPRSPYGGSDICAADGTPVTVGGYPSSPYKATPFSVTYDMSVLEPLKPDFTSCRDAAVTPPEQAPHCLQAYTITAADFTARLWDDTLPGCASQPPTQLLGYNSRVPGPTIMAPAGHEFMVRFNNKISEAALGGKLHWPCLGNRRGRPISQHLHGSASLAPYDGWADDVTCTGESKDYIYPNQRPTSAWYHDHGIHVTGDNAYHGLAGWYIITGKQKHGSCGDPYNLENIPERLVMLSDKVLDSQCQLYYNHEGPHRNNIYGDINMVNGQPWPNMPLNAGWYRFRLLNAAMVRPYLIKIKDSTGADVAQDICHVIASDGGYRPKPVQFPAEGLQISVSERYEVVCDFSRFAGQTLYLWNGRNEAMMKAVPYFCYSHLVARIQVGPPAAAAAAATGATTAPADPLATAPVDPIAPAGTVPDAATAPGATGEQPATGPSTTTTAPAATTDPTTAPGAVPAAVQLPVTQTDANATAPAGGVGAATGRRMLLGARRLRQVVTNPAPVPTGPGPQFDATKVPPQPMALNKVLSAEDLATARALIAQDKPHRTFKFGRRNGHWVINGETWDSAKIAAEDVGHNTWELWQLRTGGGWFHPIHMHLVDFYVLQRGTASGSDGLFAYERETPKDVVYLGPSQTIWLIARFGAHRGTYMFHCHNLVHEDYDMLRAMTILEGTGPKNPGTGMPSLTTVAGVVYDVYGDPMTSAAAAWPTAGPLTAAHTKAVLDKNLYRVFYPTVNDPQYGLLNSAANPWQAHVCPLAP